MTNESNAFIRILQEHLGVDMESKSVKALNDAFHTSIFESVHKPPRASVLQGWGTIEEILERPIAGNTQSSQWFVRANLLCGPEGQEFSAPERSQEMDLAVSDKIEATIRSLHEAGGSCPFENHLVWLTIRNPFSSAFPGRRTVFTDSRGILEAIHIA